MNFFHEPTIKLKRKEQMLNKRDAVSFVSSSVTVLLIDLPRLCCSLSPWRESKSAWRSLALIRFV